MYFLHPIVCRMPNNSNIYRKIGKMKRIIPLIVSLILIINLSPIVNKFYPIVQLKPIGFLTGRLAIINEHPIFSFYIMYRW